MAIYKNKIPNIPNDTEETINAVVKDDEARSNKKAPVETPKERQDAPQSNWPYRN